MGSLRRALRRKLSRKLQALKFTVQHAQKVWQLLAGNQSEESLSPIDYHIVVGNHASLLTAVVGLQQKILSTSYQLSISPCDATPSKCDHYIRIAAIWQNTLYAMLKRSGCTLANCTLCSLPPFRIHAHLRKQMDLWDPNYSRRLQSQRRIREHHIATSEAQTGLNDIPNHAMQTTRVKVAKQTVQKEQQTNRPINDLSEYCQFLDFAVGNFRCKAPSVCLALCRGRSTFGPPLWWFHRWRHRSGCRRRARQFLVGNVCCRFDRACVNAFIAFPKRTVGKV
jgi:hypothetical protein